MPTKILAKIAAKVAVKPGVAKPGKMAEAPAANLKFLLNECRKGIPLQCAFGMNDSHEAVLELHKTKHATSLLNELRRSAGRLQKVGIGVATISENSPQIVLITSEQTLPGGMARPLAKALKGTGYKRVCLAWPGGREMGDHEEAVVAPGGGDEQVQEAAPPARPTVVVDQKALAIAALKSVAEGHLVSLRRRIETSGDQGLGYERALVIVRSSIDAGNVQVAIDQLRKIEDAMDKADIAATPLPDRDMAGVSAEADALLVTTAEFVELKDARIPLKVLRTLLRAEHEGHNISGTAFATLQTEKAMYSLAAQERTLRQQKATYARMDGIFKRVENTYLTKAAGESLVAETAGFSKCSDQFKAYVAAVTAFGADRTADNAKAVEAAAKVYLDHNDKLNPFAASTKSSKRKRQICETGIVAARQFQQAKQFRAIGAPPWDEEKAIRMGSVQAAFSFETAYVAAEPLGEEGGVSSSFWVIGHKPPQPGDPQLPPDQRGDIDEGVMRDLAQEFIFKPASGEMSMNGFPAGGSAPREAVSCRLADNVFGMTGIDLAVPATSIAAIDPQAIGGFTGPKPASGSSLFNLPAAAGGAGLVTGSIQAFAPSKGPLYKAGKSGDVLASMPQAECERLAVLDMLTLNLDRHSGNVMLGEDGASLIPIDHGLTFPSFASFAERAQDRLGGVQNITLRLAHSHEPFSSTMKTKLALLDPDALAGGITASIASLDAAQPGLKAPEMIPEENIELARRSAAFLKKAAAADLTPAQAQLIIAHFGSNYLFDCRNTHFDAVADDLIEKLKANCSSGSVKRFYTELAGSHKDIWDRLRSKGWHAYGRYTNRYYLTWLHTYLDTLLAAYKNKEVWDQASGVPQGGMEAAEGGA